jgi:hypothetical protein
MRIKRSHWIWTRIARFGYLLTPGYCLLATASIAQITFERTYGVINSDHGEFVQQTMDGGYIIAGTTHSIIGREDVYLIKTDAFGDTLWTRFYGGTDFDRGFSGQQTSDGGYIIAGVTRSFGAGMSDVYLVKTDSLGDTLWTRTFGGNRVDEGYSVQETSDGGFVIAGWTQSFGSTFVDVYLIKTDSSGDTLWTRAYEGNTGINKGYSVQQTAPDGGYIIAGRRKPLSAADYDVYLIKTDSLGDTLWTRIYGGTADDVGYSVQQTSDGGYIIAGYTKSFGADSGDVYLIKTDSSGNLLWAKTYGGSLRDVGHSVQQTIDGGYIITGFKDYEFIPPFPPWSDLYLIKTDSMGDTLWTRAYGDTSLDAGASVQQTTDGGYIITGFFSFDPDERDVYLIKTNEDGLLGVEENNNAKLKIGNAKLLQNQPNPFHFSTVIRYQIPSTNHITLSIYDITGRLVETLVDKSQESGVYRVKWEGKGQSSGIYFYRLVAGDPVLLPTGQAGSEVEVFTSTRKLILLR